MITTTKPLNQNKMKATHRVWLEDSVEKLGGFWWYCYLDHNGCLQDEKYPDDIPETPQWYINNGYKVEEL
jgi:hypothetical protein